MDPITIGLIALGVGAVIAMVFFLIASVGLYLSAIITAIREFDLLRKRLEQRLLQIRKNEQDKAINEQRRRENEQRRQKLEALRRELDREIKEMKEEEEIAKEIQKIVSKPPHKIALNLVKLVQLIYQSYILKNNLKNPEESINSVKRKVERIEREFEQLNNS